MHEDPYGNEKEGTRGEKRRTGGEEEDGQRGENRHLEKMERDRRKRVNM